MIVRGGTIVTAGGVEVADIAIEDGLITEVGPNLGGGGEEIDATGLYVFPGGIDSHVHFNEPGRTEWEDIAHGSAALEAGGYTAFVDMPLNNLPVTTTVEAFDLKLAAMRRSSKVDYGLWGGLVPGNLDQIGPLVERGVMGFKAFMCPSGIDEFPAADERTLRDRRARLDPPGTCGRPRGAPRSTRSVARRLHRVASGRGRGHGDPQRDRVGGPSGLPPSHRACEFTSGRRAHLSLEARCERRDMPSLHAVRRPGHGTHRRHCQVRAAVS